MILTIDIDRKLINDAIRQKLFHEAFFNFGTERYNDVSKLLFVIWKLG